MDSILAWMAMLARPGRGAMWIRHEVSQAGSAMAAWEHWAAQRNSQAKRALDEAKRQHEVIRSLGADVVTFHDSRYPELLAHIADAPPVLYAKGSWPRSDAWGRSLSVVGTRACSPRAADWAEQAGREWTEAGGRLVSGLARGIDGRAHQGALNGMNGGAQVAVLPCALDAIHPRMHVGVADEILQRGGLLVSEQPPGIEVQRWMFASRNRILTGLSPTTVVIQSPARGGSLISAQCAFHQNREVFALWQRGLGKGWEGNRALVADEIAHPVSDVNELWRVLSKDVSSRKSLLKKGKVAVGFPAACQEVWAVLDNKKPVTWTELSTLFSSRVKDLERQLFTLEMLGWIRRLPGRAFLRN